MRAGFTVFPISPRNSPAAIAHLLLKTSPAHLIIGPEPSLKELMAISYDLIKKDGAQPPQVSEMPFFDALYGTQLSPFEPLPPVKRGHDDIALIMHSSGRLYVTQCIQTLMFYVFQALQRFQSPSSGPTIGPFYFL